jgi:CheY-like chemotaxis protein
LQKILIEDGHSVHQTDDGGSALELIRVLKPYVAVIDIDVANLDGITLLREIRRSSVTRGLPVVLTGTSERAAIRASALHLGVVDYLVRSFEAADVALRVKWSLKDQGSVPAVPWDLTNLNLRELLSDGPETIKAPERTTGISKAGFRKLAEDAGYLPGARMEIMTPEKGGMVETGDGIVRVEVPPGSMRRAMSLGAARVNENSEMLAESLSNYPKTVSRWYRLNQKSRQASCMSPR